MGLIKKIKDTEKQAQQLIEKTKADVKAQQEEAIKKRLQTFEEAENKRKQQIQQAAAKAEQQANDEIQMLKQQAKDDFEQLRNKANAKKKNAIIKIMDYLKG
jgi:vacuolar-type H+-ATPase subunit H